MAKVYPSNSLSPTSTTTCSWSSYRSSTREVFTIWMKSLIYNSNGCTVYNSNGEIVYRIDNYDTKHSNQVHLMDASGKTLFTISRKKFSTVWCWEGFQYDGLDLKQRRPTFRVKKNYRLTKGKPSSHQVVVGRDDKEQVEGYRIEGSCDKVSCKILDQQGRLVAEVVKKESTSGVMFGDDVMRLVVEPNNVDHSLVMSFIIVYTLTNNKM